MSTHLTICGLFKNQEIFFCIEHNAVCCLLTTVMFEVLKLSQQQNSMKCSRSDSCVKMWRFSNISGTVFFSIFRVKKGAESASEMSENLHVLTRLSAQKHFIVLWCIMVWNSNAPSATNTSFDLLPDAVKKLVTFAKPISLLTAFSCFSHSMWAQRSRAHLLTTRYQQRPKTRIFLEKLSTLWTQFWSL